MPGVRQTSSGVVQTTAGVVITGIPRNGLEHDYDATAESAGESTTWSDQVGALDLSINGGSIVSNGINGNQSSRYDNTDDNTLASTASDWNFLHDGSAFSMYIVVELKSDGEFRNVASTQSGGGISASFTGLTLARDDRTGSGFDDTLRVAVGNGSTLLINSQLDTEFPSNSPEIYAVRFDGTDQYHIDRAKTTLDSPTATGHTTNDADNPLRNGDGGSTSPMDGDIGRQLYYTTFHDDATRDQTVDAIANQFGITL